MRRPSINYNPNSMEANMTPDADSIVALFVVPAPLVS